MMPEDVVYVVDAGRSRTTFFNEQTMISALRTVWYSKANGFQRRGRAGRCRPGVWYRLFTSVQWDAMDEYELPEMQRSPLEELCLEAASDAISVPVAVRNWLQRWFQDVPAKRNSEYFPISRTFVQFSYLYCPYICMRTVDKIHVQSQFTCFTWANGDRLSL